MTSTSVNLPPGQIRLDRFPRFGTHLHEPPPEVPTDPVIEVCGTVTKAFTVPVADLATLPRRDLVADFHCVAGWSATDLHWQGVAFETLYRAVIEPSVRPGATVTHVVFTGLDGFQSAVLIEDALADDVLIADRLDGQPLGADHGAPARLVSPGQYGYINTKHLCRIDLRTSAPNELGAATRLARVALRGPFIKRHPRARVWKEERHPYLPASLLRPFYRLFIPAGLTTRLLARSGQRRVSGRS